MKWFYTQVGTEEIDTKEKLKERFDDLGADGWEFVGVVKALLIFKKPEDIPGLSSDEMDFMRAAGWAALPPVDEIIANLPAGIKSKSSWAHNAQATDGRPIAVLRHNESGRYVGVDAEGSFYTKTDRNLWTKRTRAEAMDAYIS